RVLQRKLTGSTPRGSKARRGAWRIWRISSLLPFPCYEKDAGIGPGAELGGSVLVGIEATANLERVAINFINSFEDHVLLLTVPEHHVNGLGLFCGVEREGYLKRTVLYASRIFVFLDGQGGIFQLVLRHKFAVHFERGHDPGSLHSFQVLL